eukprot:SAG31_NODE_4069_length_3619_cov_17.893466_4_plen_93_part_00
MAEADWLDSSHLAVTSDAAEPEAQLGAGQLEALLGACQALGAPVPDCRFGTLDHLWFLMLLRCPCSAIRDGAGSAELEELHQRMTKLMARRR